MSAGTNAHDLQLTGLNGLDGILSQNFLVNTDNHLLVLQGVPEFPAARLIPGENIVRQCSLQMIHAVQFLRDIDGAHEERHGMLVVAETVQHHTDRQIQPEEKSVRLRGRIEEAKEVTCAIGTAECQ